MRRKRIRKSALCQAYYVVEYRFGTKDKDIVKELESKDMEKQSKRMRASGQERKERE